MFKISSSLTTRFSALLFCTFSLGVQASFADDTCFYRSYSVEHMRQHPGQTLRQIGVRTDFNSQVSVAGVSAVDGKVYRFFGDVLAKKTSAESTTSCAGFTADGDQQVGCAQVTKLGETSLSLSPKSIIYNDGYQRTKSRGITLLRCEGTSSDGEGCESGKLRKIEMLSANAEDSNYVLEKIDCL
jgi:hypothetical protein